MYIRGGYVALGRPGYRRVTLRIRTLVTLVTWMVMPISTINLTTLAVLFDISLFIYIYIVHHFLDY